MATQRRAVIDRDVRVVCIIDSLGAVQLRGNDIRDSDLG
jgi:hypothetical protein